MTEHNRYRTAGVDIAAGQHATALMRDAVRSTYGDEVLAGIGAFGGLFAATSLHAMQHPVLVASTDGVGTKTLVAARMQRWDTIGHDLVHHCVNDILVQGARPLFFLDYIAAAQIQPAQVSTVVQGIAAACRTVGCALLGGETAEMPGVYQPDTLDLAGTIVGVVEREQIIDGSAITPGDVIVALPSSGLHTNGYSLARHVFADADWDAPHPDLYDGTIGEALLAVHTCYLKPVQQLQAAGITIHGMAHITGGGVYENLPRILPAGTGATIVRGTWHEPLIFALLQQMGQVSAEEMFHATNMGLGMLLVVPAATARQVTTIVPNARIVGEVVAGEGVQVRDL